jgi:hypothetical protein
MQRDVIYSLSEDGERLPVIDVTHPAFAVSTSDAELKTMEQEFLMEQQRQGEVPPAVREALKRSIFGQALMKASGSFLPSMITYRMKLGPDRLGADAQEIDRRIAASFPVLTSRIRLQDMARLLADGLAPRIAVQPRRPVYLLNIAGGPGADSWNTLIHLRFQHPALLEGREMVIAVLDLDDRGPAFGERALAALQAPDGPLEGTRAGFRFIRYNWSESGQLAQALSELHAEEAACAISSEGGLFEYGSDEEILANLAALRAGTAFDAIVVGSVTRDCEAVRSTQIRNCVATRPRTIEGFQSLADRAGWIVDQVIERLFSYNLRLLKR